MVFAVIAIYATRPMARAVPAFGTSFVALKLKGFEDLPRSREEFALALILRLLHTWQPFLDFLWPLHGGMD